MAQMLFSYTLKNKKVCENTATEKVKSICSFSPAAVNVHCFDGLKSKQTLFKTNHESAAKTVPINRNTWRRTWPHPESCHKRLWSVSHWLDKLRLLTSHEYLRSFDINKWILVKFLDSSKMHSFQMSPHCTCLCPKLYSIDPHSSPLWVADNSSERQTVLTDSEHRRSSLITTAVPACPRYFK